MSSIIEGYLYDVFISYRQKDNKHDGWVTEFVNQLKGELESTFKEEISVYFDINPHNGLLETHDVDESLKEKLRCLIFIPIISRTYCDPKSFAWEHEFKAFVEQASQDRFGLKVKLPGGNVASRVLPVRIHDLDNEDIKLCESILGGVMRGVEFIYKEPGVNRSLLPNDHEEKNLNNTTYRNQINKVALAIKEIISAIEQYSPEQEEVQKEITKPAPVLTKNHKTTIIAVLAIALALIILGIFFIPKLLKPSEQLEKSIAVLPFINDSPDQENAYFINGIMEEVLNNLQKIRDFRVLSRTSTEQYRGSVRPPIPKIGKALDVNYIVEGSGQKYGNKFVLRVQLIAANNERHLWAKSYNREILQTSDIINIQSEIAQLIAAELQTTITPEEKQTIEKIPTTNLTAYDLYQKGKEKLMQYGFYDYDLKPLNEAKIYYEKALQYDSTFALAYSGLAMIQWNLIYRGNNSYIRYLSRNAWDSVLLLTDKSIRYDNKVAEAYFTKAIYYWTFGNADQCEKELDEALKYNPNYPDAYFAKGEFIYLSDYKKLDYVKGLENLHKATNINHSKELPGLLRSLGDAYGLSAGFYDKAIYYYNEALKLDNDSITYFKRLAGAEYTIKNFANATKVLQNILAIDSTDIDINLALGQQYLYLGQFRDSFKYFKKCVEYFKSKGSMRETSLHRFGYIYWQNGFKKEGNYWINRQKEICEEEIKMRVATASVTLNAYYDLAGICAFQGEKEKAYENLHILEQMNVFPKWWISLIETDPLFNNIRNEPEFQKIVSDLEVKYQAEHERVRKWLEEQGML
jgi:TolB-like protein/Tfp pilus assembly protein PilF